MTSVSYGLSYDPIDDMIYFVFRGYDMATSTYAVIFQEFLDEGRDDKNKAQFERRIVERMMEDIEDDD